MLLDYFSDSVANFISKKLFINLSRRVWIIFRLNFNTFFWQYILSLYFPLQILSYAFPKEPSKLFVTLAACLRIISPRPRHSEQACSIVSGLLFSFPKRFAGEMFVVLIFDICNVYEIIAYDWLYSWYWGRVKMVDVASKFLGNIKDCHLFLVC